MREIKYRIFFGKNGFRVSKFVYKEFNRLKDKPRAFNKLYNIIKGIYGKSKF